MKWSIREAVDVYFKAKSTFKLGARTLRAGEPALIFDTVKTGTLEVTSEESQLTGGRGNSTILSFDGDKKMTFKFEDALLSNEGLAILAGAELIPARNKYVGSGNKYAADAKSVISHYTEKVEVANDGVVKLSKKPYIGRGSDLYVMLLDDAGEMSGVPVQVNLAAEAPTAASETSESANVGLRTYIEKFVADDKVVPYKVDGTAITEVPSNVKAGVFDDGIAYYVKDNSGAFTAKAEGTKWYDANVTANLNFLVGQPSADEDGKYTAHVNSIKAGDVVLLDYYIESRHNATQISILPDKFAPYMYVEGSSLIKRASDGADLPVEFAIPKLKIKTALTFTLQSTGDASTFNFEGEAFPDYTKFDKTKKVLADIQILDADDNYDLTGGDDAGDPTDYVRYQYDDNTEGEYLWKDPKKTEHENIDYTDEQVANTWSLSTVTTD